MKILKYKYWDLDKKGWDIAEVEFSNINLLVGDSGSGKTRFLNTVFNLGRWATGSKKAKNGVGMLLLNMTMKSINGNLLYLKMRRESQLLRRNT